jgi:hypothetical protein
MSTEHDLEYGPTPPGSQYEHTDIEVAIGYNFAVWLFVAMLLSLGVVYGAFYLFEDRKQDSDVAAQQFPMAAGQEREPPSPRLQTQPFKDVYLLKQGQNQRLDSYGWSDRPNGFVHIPIERAMELTRETQAPSRPDGKPTPSTIVEDSSSGRTTAVR